MIIFNAAHLRRVLKAYAVYYNKSRTQLSLEKDAPITRTAMRCGAIDSVPHLRGLHDEHARIE